MKLEICANSYQSALNAQIADADRIELCSELSLGGITPTYGLLKQVSDNLKIAVNVLIRPRSGDFCYSNDEFLQMKENIKLCKKFGFNGIVSGVLNPNNTIDIKRTKEIIELSKPLSFTFHRAFDCTPNPKKSLHQLLYLGVNTILTSGIEEKAENGIELLKELKEIAKNKLIILPGSGINPQNTWIFKTAGFKEIHTSASKKIEFKNDSHFNTQQTVSDVSTMKEILNILKKI